MSLRSAALRSSTLRVGLLGNSALALPAVDALQRSGRLAALGVPAVAHDGNHRLQAIAGERGLPLGIAREASLGEDLGRWISDARLDVVFVVTFPYRVPREVLAAPPLGVFNLHASPLPRFRGPDPLFWQLRDGVETSVLCAHRMTPGLDEGPIALQAPLLLTPDDTYGVAHFRAGFVAAEVVNQLAELLERHGNDLPLIEQDESQATRSSRPETLDLVVDWSAQSAQEVCGLVRACNPGYGGAVSFFRGVPLRIYEASAVPGDERGRPGEVLSVDPSLRVGCRDGAVELEVLHTDDGVFSGRRLARVFGLAVGETLGAPADC